MTIISNHKTILRIYLYNNRQLYNVKDDKETKKHHETHMQQKHTVYEQSQAICAHKNTASDDVMDRIK